MNSDSPVAVITGAANGFGKALSIGLAQHGYHLVLLDKQKAALELLHGEIVQCAPSAEVKAFEVDVANKSQVCSAIDTSAKHFNRIDVLFNNAGIGIPGGSNIAHEDFIAQIDVNLIGAFNCIKAIAPIMKNQKSGYIFNMSSMAAKFIKANRIGLGTSKIALLGLNEALYREMVEHNVKVTALVPHYFGVLRAPGGGKTSINSNETIPLEDLVNTVMYLIKLSPNTSIKEVVIDY